MKTSFLMEQVQSNQYKNPYISWTYSTDYSNNI